MAFKDYVDKCIRLVEPNANDGPKSRETYTCWPPPVFMIIISLLQITLFSIDASKGYTQGDGYIATILIYDASKKKCVWRFLTYITYMFVHLRIFHISSNLLIQLVLGFPLELVYRWRIVLVYLAGVVAGSLVSSLVYSSHPIAGASSGVYALISVHIANIALNYSEKKYAIQLVVYLIFVIVLHVLSPSPLILIHGAGAVTGLLLRICVLRKLDITNGNDSARVDYDRVRTGSHILNLTIPESRV